MGDRDAGWKLTPKAKQARRHLAYTIHMVGGTMRDSALNKKILHPESGEPSVTVTSHMRPIMTATEGLVNFEADDDAVDAYDAMSAEERRDSGAVRSGEWGPKLYGSTTLRVAGPDGAYLSLGSKRKKMADGRRQTESTVKVSSSWAKSTASIDEKIPEWKKTSPRVKGVGDPVDDNSLLVTFLKGQAQLLEQLLSTY